MKKCMIAVLAAAVLVSLCGNADTDHIVVKAVLNRTELANSPMRPEPYAAKVHYRLRYLNSYTNDWHEALINLKTLTADIPIDRNFNGDIEYYFSCDSNAPYFKYVDYSGLGIGLPNYSEERSSTTNKAEVGHWFIRVKNGKIVR